MYTRIVKSFGASPSGSTCQQSADCDSGICCGLAARSSGLPNVCVQNFGQCAEALNEIEKTYCSRVGGLLETVFVQGSPVLTCAEPGPPSTPSSGSSFVTSSPDNEKTIGVTLPVVAVAAVVFAALLIL